MDEEEEPATRRIIIAADIPAHLNLGSIAMELSGNEFVGVRVWAWEDFWADVSQGVLGPEEPELLCAYPSGNHSSDRVRVYHGAEDRLLLCGYHATWDLNQVLRDIEEAS